jgi:transcription elongation factor
MKSESSVSEEGRWVQVRKGTYKGDVGVVVAVEAWGVDILLVPRLKLPTRPPSPNGLKISLKRKRALPPAPPPKQQLFDPQSYKRIYGVNPKRQRNDIYTVPGFTFEHGLVRKEFDCHSISYAANIPLDVLFLFLGTKHPVVLNTWVPRPQEWDFEIGDEIIVCSTGKRGVVMVLEDDYLEVVLASLEGLTRVAWADVRKYFVVGDFVRVTGGPSNGKTGWIVELDEQGFAFIIVKTVKGEILTADPSRALDVRHSEVLSTSTNLLQTLELHVNLLKGITEPVIHTSHPPSMEDHPLKTDKSPWLNLGVTIICGAFKGYRGTIKNVLLGQPTISGQRIEVQLSHIGGARPFARELFDYDDIMETR